MKNANLNLDFKTLLPKLKKAQEVLLKHAVFIALILVLLVYVFIVQKINQFANAEPTASAQTVALAKAAVPRIDKSAIQQIQSLENTNTQTQALFEQARNNPFQE
jgi:predicted PurR-regulated permease PerM